ncbi:hypothetical protein H0E87_016787 [Populus deltoides]|uniref:non-specific serine/threonine protein kinase n=1 Tax=Populus deltoides TaxID=3696 RepID=A0A8T2YAU2_POPDE|nr:hypothetical protein H0E87_016787 [Populus deltoides]
MAQPHLAGPYFPPPFPLKPQLPLRTLIPKPRLSNPLPATILSATAMEPVVEDLTDDLDNLSLSSTTTTTTAAETRHSTGSGSETTWTTSTSSLVSNSCKPHHPPQCDQCWHAIQRDNCDNSPLTLADLRFVHKLGSGDIGSVYLVELKEGNGWSCLLTEFCPGGDLHVLRQQQPDRRFGEAAIRFYASEVVAALEYLHMMGIVYRDLKPENVLVRLDGHIMLTDFDLSLKDDNSPSTAQIISDQNHPPTASSTRDYPSDTSQFATSSCILPSCIVPAVSCFHHRRKRKKKLHQRGTLEIVAEPIDVRSMSFVGTHEYLAPEIVSGEGHGNAVDWWTLGIFMFEMFYGVTPFKGMDHELTLANIVARALEFPKEPSIPVLAKDLITQLLIKDPVRRLGSTMGATAIKHHQFFDGINWALLRCRTPPYIPRPVTYKNLVVAEHGNNSIEYY